MYIWYVIYFVLYCMNIMPLHDQNPYVYVAFRKVSGFRLETAWQTWVCRQATHLSCPVLGSSMNRLAVINYRQATLCCFGFVLLCSMRESSWLLGICCINHIGWFTFMILMIFLHGLTLWRIVSSKAWTHVRKLG